MTDAAPLILPADGPQASPAARRIFAALDGQARQVGGVARDALLGRPWGDVDYATPLLPDETMRRLSAAGIKAIPTGLAHGTITAVIDRQPAEITTLRRDVATDGRHAEVAFTADWAADAARRDFTMNALYIDAEGRIHDPLGTGIADARAGRLRFVGDAAARAREDYLRILRYFRFFAWYGRGASDADALAACAAEAPGLDRLSAERVWSEVKKLLAAPDPVPALLLASAAGVLARVLPEAGTPAPLVGLKSPPGLPFERVALRRLSGLLAPAEDGVGLARRLKLSGAEAKALAGVQACARCAADSRAAPWGVIRRWGREQAEDGLAVARARGALGNHVAAALATWDDPPFPLRAADLAAAGIAPGPEMGRRLKAAEAWWESQACVPDRAACLAAALTAPTP